MAKILVHITCGTENPTKAALGFHVAKAAAEQGHTVTLFLAGDGVQLLRDGAIDNLNGLGTGNLRQLYDALIANNVQFYVSGMSAKTRGLTEAELDGKPTQFGSPADLVRLSLEHDRVICY